MGDERPRAPGPVPLRPLGFGDVLDGAFKILRSQWRALAIAAAVVLVPLELASSYIQRGTLATGFPDLFAGLDPEAPALPDEALLATVGIAAAMLLVAYPLLFGALIRIAVGVVLGRPVEAGEALRTALRRWPAMFVAWLTTMVLAAIPLLLAAGLVAAGILAEAVALVLIGTLGLLLSVPVGVFIAALFLAAPAAIVVEGAGPFAGLRRSASLLGRRVFGVFGVAVVALLLLAVIDSALAMIPTLLGMVVGETYGWVIVAAGSILGSLVTLPFFASVLALLYLDGRIRREGLDLEVIADRLAEQAPPGDVGFDGA